MENAAVATTMALDMSSLSVLEMLNDRWTFLLLRLAQAPTDLLASF